MLTFADVVSPPSPSHCPSSLHYFVLAADAETGLGGLDKDDDDRLPCVLLISSFFNAYETCYALYLYLHTIPITDRPKLEPSTTSTIYRIRIIGTSAQLTAAEVAYTGPRRHARISPQLPNRRIDNHDSVARLKDGVSSNDTAIPCGATPTVTGLHSYIERLHIWRYYVFRSHVRHYVVSGFIIRCRIA